MKKPRHLWVARFFYGRSSFYLLVTALHRGNHDGPEPLSAQRAQGLITLPAA
ncbi:MULTISPECIES: hypothetical protein [Pseudomonas]|uniref:hypothetical protein n=1 Tax=Pseudomonas TaxID=286 RepID=UPI00272C3899|nr:hypothetical protein [Pseudomonas sp. OVF7]WLD66230.1 hypothetical protein QU606_28455 [Pseudomonas sp. OVF7]